MAGAIGRSSAAPVMRPCRGACNAGKMDRMACRQHGSGSIPLSMTSEKLTTDPRKPASRRYDEGCAATHAMDIIGQRWALPVMRELMLGPRRFGDLKNSINGISANLLTQRLGSLEAAGVLRRATLPPPASVPVYELTRWGHAALPLFDAMGQWGARSPGHDHRRPLSATALLLTLRSMIDGAAAAPLEGTIRLTLDGEDFSWTKDGEDIRLARGTPDRWRVSIAGAPEVLAGWLFGEGEEAMLAAADQLSVEGDLDFAMRFADCFGAASSDF
jgi:DNA-binding HxlR family transcriptional regulator